MGGLDNDCGEVQQRASARSLLGSAAYCITGISFGISAVEGLAQRHGLGTRFCMVASALSTIDKLCSSVGLPCMDLGYGVSAAVATPYWTHDR